MDEVMRQAKRKGFNVDFNLSEENWSVLDELTSTKLGWGDLLGRNVNSYRDERPRESLHLKDYRDCEKTSKQVVAELEHYNPKFHPIKHVLVDFPMWVWKR